MMQKASLKYQFEIDSLFWRKYKILWERLINPSPFYSPSFLKILLEHHNDSIIIYVEDEKRNIIGVLFLRNIKNKLIFLNNEHSDHNPFIISNNLNVLNQKLILDSFISVIPNKFSIYLTNIPLWNSQLKWFIESLRKNKFNVIDSVGWIAPCVEFENSEVKSTKDFFYKIFNKSRTNNYHNRLKKMTGYQFEVFDNDDTDLEGWIEEYCDNHEERWNQTETPSKYSLSNERKLIYEKAKALHLEGLLLRFSIKVNYRRIATVICYRQGFERLIYGLPSFSTEFNHLQPGTILLSSIGKWVGENGYKIFDFGLGSEKYKLRYANKDQELYRIFASRSSFSILLIRGFLEQKIRASKNLNNLWENWYNRKIRKYINKQKINVYRLKISFNLFRTAPLFHTKRIIRTRSRPLIFYYKLNKEKNIIYENEKYDIVNPSLSSILEFTKNNPSLNLKSRSNYIKRFHSKNQIAYAILKNNKIVQLSWVSNEVEENVRTHANIMPESKVIKIYDCITDINHRRKGFYFTMLYEITKKHFDKDIIIYHDDWNTPSQKTILQLGFIQFGIRKGYTNKWKL
jgi:hypothetical protein